MGNTGNDLGKESVGKLIFNTWASNDTIVIVIKYTNLLANVLF